MEGNYTGAEHTYTYATLTNINAAALTEKYSLPETIKQKLLSNPTPFTTPYPQTVYLKNYSRVKPDGTKETWADTVIRVTEGTFSAYLDHHHKNGRLVDRQQLDTFAESFAESFYRREWCPPGRGLFAMGTDHTAKNGNASLNNCYATETKNLPMAAAWAADMLMCGGGVGFDCSWDGIAFWPNKEDSFTFVVPDTRQGWCAAIELLCRAYVPIDGVITNKFPNFDFSLIRSYGTPIKGFGGTASGPDPLKVCLKRIEIFFDTYLGFQWHGGVCSNLAFEATILEKKKKVFRRMVSRLKEVNAFYVEKPEQFEAGFERALATGLKTYGKTRLVTDVFNTIGVCVVAGNVRRSAMIAVSDAGDTEFLELKNKKINPEREPIMWMSNNTLRFEKDEDFELCIPEIARRIRDNGEPGFFNVINARKYGRYTDTRYGEDHGRLLNPCVTGDTLVLTTEGLKRADSLRGRQFVAIVDGRNYESTFKGFWKTGEREVYRITLKNGMSIKATDNHPFLKVTDKKTMAWEEVKDLNVGDVLALADNTGVKWEGGRGTWHEGYFCGQLIGDGTFDKETPIVALWIDNGVNIKEHLPAKYLLELAKTLKSRSDFNGWHVEKRTEKYTKYAMKLKSFKDITDEFGIYALEKKVPEKNLSYDFTCGLLSGFFDADGSVQGSSLHKGMSVRLGQTELDRLEAVQCLLASIGIMSIIYKNRKDAHIGLLPDGKGGNAEYHCKAMHELVITRQDMRKFADIVGFCEPEKQNKLLERLSQYTRGPRASIFESAIHSIEKEEEIVPVYDCTINEIHCYSAQGLLSHNCSEILLEPFEPCTLATVAPINCTNSQGGVDKDRVMAACRYATFYASTVTTIRHHWNVSDDIIKRNRRIGVSFTGIADVYEKYGFTYLTALCRKMYSTIRAFNQEYADRAGIPRAIRVTTVKPEGTLSIVMGVNAGVHFPICRWAERRIAFLKGDPTGKCLKEAGYPSEESTYNPKEEYIILPLEFGQCRPSNEVGIYEQFGIVSALQRCYSDNSVSFTGHFSEQREAKDVERVIAMFAPQIKTCSMMPYSDDKDALPKYPHMPFTEITEERYKELVSVLKSIKWDFSQGSDASMPRGCTNDSCELPSR